MDALDTGIATGGNLAQLDRQRALAAAADDLRQLADKVEADDPEALELVKAFAMLVQDRARPQVTANRAQRRAATHASRRKGR